MLMQGLAAVWGIALGVVLTLWYLALRAKRAKRAEETERRRADALARIAKRSQEVVDRFRLPQRAGEPVVWIERGREYPLSEFRSPGGYYLHRDVEIDHIRNIDEGCTYRFDSDGALHLDARTPEERKAHLQRIRDQIDAVRKISFGALYGLNSVNRQAVVQKLAQLEHEVRTY